MSAVLKCASGLIDPRPLSRGSPRVASNEVHAVIAHPSTRRQLIGFARRFVDAADVEDVVQEALLSASRAADAFESRSNPLRWLYRIVANAGRMARRARRRTRRGGDFHHVTLDEIREPAESHDPERVLLAREALALVARELAILPKIDTELVCRFVLDEEPLETLAVQSSLTRSAVKSRMFRVRRALLARCVE